MMVDKVEVSVLAARMRYDGWKDVTEVVVAYTDKREPEYQVEADHPRTGERVYIANLGVYHQSYAQLVAS